MIRSYLHDTIQYKVNKLSQQLVSRPYAEVHTADLHAPMLVMVLNLRFCDV